MTREAQIATVKAHIIADPESAGYSGMTDQQIVDEVKVSNKTITRKTLNSTDVFNAIVQSEYDVASDAKKQALQLLFTKVGSGGTFNIENGSTDRTWLLDIFSAGTSRTNLLALAADYTGTSEEKYGLGDVTLGVVTKARVA